MKEEKHLDMCGGLREDTGTKTDLHGSMDDANTLKLRFGVRDLDLPERRKRSTNSREEDVVAHMCPCGTTIESRGECETHKVERDVLVEEMRKLDECDMEALWLTRE